MRYDFYADRVDKLSILEYIFNETDLQVFDLTSAYGQEIYQYTSSDEVATKFDLFNGDKFAVTFQLWTPRHGGHLLLPMILIYYAFTFIIGTHRTIVGSF